MFETIFESATGTAITTGGALLGILAALVLGTVVCLTYSKCVRGAAGTQNFLLTLIILPAVIAVIIMLVGSNVARAFSLAGAFSLVRFRSEPGDPKDIAYICIVMAIGLGAGMGFILFTILFTAILCAVLFLFALATRSSTDTSQMIKITVPENLNYTHAFDEVFTMYTESHALLRVRTVDLGSMFRLDYTVKLKDPAQEKEFIDALRARNGNLEISMLLTGKTTG